MVLWLNRAPGYWLLVMALGPFFLDFADVRKLWEPRVVLLSYYAVLWGERKICVACCGKFSLIADNEEKECSGVSPISVFVF